MIPAVEILAEVWHGIGCAYRPFQKNGGRNPNGTSFEMCKFKRVHEETARDAFRLMAERGYHVRYEAPEAQSVPMFGDAP